MNEIQAEKLDRFVNSVNNEVDEKINKICYFQNINERLP